MTTHPVVSPAEWQKSRKALLEKEKAFTRARDELSAARRQLPWERVEKSYIFDGPQGPESLSDLFAGRSQLVVYHFMFGPDAERGCKSCSFWADNFNGAVPHLAARDVTLVAVSRAPVSKLEAFKKRLGWSFKWLSSGGNDFNYDFHASFTPEQIRAGKAMFNYATVPAEMAEMSDREGASAFYRDRDGTIYHTYSTWARGIDLLNTTYNFLDLTAKGRDENTEFTQAWVRFHDRYKRS